MDKRKKIFICVPNMGSVVPDLVRNLVYWSHSKNYYVGIPFMLEGIFPLDAARNRCIKEFLETDADYLWWIDADIVPPLDALDRLVTADKDIIGATCFSMKNDNGRHFPYPVTLRYNKDRKYEVHYGNGIEQIDATGGACVLFKRKVYEAVERPYEFLYYLDGTLQLTCDFYVFQKTEKLGFKLYVDYNLLCDHQRKVSIRGVQDLLAGIATK
jgi:glycosyltransferase involved in cell wall biosynthesis